jgi:hypothetical protein
MGTLNSWAIVDANNNATPPDGWPENTMDYSDVNNTGRAVQGTMKRYFADINGSLAAGGIADVYTLSLNESGYAAYFDGMMFSCSIPVTNLTAAPTLDVNGIGAANIVDRVGNALSIGELVAGGIYEFLHDGTNLRLAGSGGTAGLDTQLQYNNGGIFGGTVGLTYNDGTDELTIVNPVNVTVDIILSDQADHTATPGAGIGLIWLRDDGLLIYTNPSGVDVSIGTAGVSLPGGADTQMQFNDSGVFGGIPDWSYNATLDVMTMVFDNTGGLSNNPIQITADAITSGSAISISVGDDGNLSLGNAISIIGGVGGGGGDSAGMISSVSNNTSSAGRFANNLAAGRALHAFSNVASRTVELVLIEVDSSSSAPAVVVQMDGDAPHINLTGTQGTGIQFKATADPSAGANVLDDYQEGTFTPLVEAGDGSNTATYSTQNGRSTKIGNLIVFSCHIVLTGLGDMTIGANTVRVLLGTLPASVDINTAFAAKVVNAQSVNAESKIGFGHVGANSQLLGYKSEGTVGDTVFRTDELTATTEISISGCYLASVS